MKLLHLSDLHLGAVSIDGIQRKLDFISKTYPEHWIIVTGDITENGNPTEYYSASQLLSPFRGRIIICPGNHDYCQGGYNIDYSPAKARYFDQYLSGPLNQNGTFAHNKLPVTTNLGIGTVIALDSVLESNEAVVENNLSTALGMIPTEQMSALDGYLNSGGYKIVILHHNPKWGYPFWRLLNTQKFQQLVSGRAQLVLFGHSHDQIQYTQSGTIYLCAAKMERVSSVAEISLGEGIHVNQVPITPPFRFAPSFLKTLDSEEREALMSTAETEAKRTGVYKEPLTPQAKALLESLGESKTDLSDLAGFFDNLEGSWSLGGGIITVTAKLEGDKVVAKALLLGFYKLAEGVLSLENPMITGKLDLALAKAEIKIELKNQSVVASGKFCVLNPGEAEEGFFACENFETVIMNF